MLPKRGEGWAFVSVEAWHLDRLGHEKRLKQVKAGGDAVRAIKFGLNE